MRIHLVGSEPNNAYNRDAEHVQSSLAAHSALYRAAGDIGAEAARRGHTLIVGSDFQLTIDHHAVRKGLVPVVTAHPTREFYLEVWRPNDTKRPFEDLRQTTNLVLDYQVRRPTYPMDHRKSTASATAYTNVWTFAHQSAIANADVVVALAGGDGTERAVLTASEVNVPVLPLRTFGGGAARAYATMESELLNCPGGHCLSAEWSPDRASDVIALAERVGIHSYFISYSHAHVEWCDLVHLALYSSGRVVLRDRSELSLGRDVQPRLMRAIGKAETFLLLWSQEAKESKWCRTELKRALNLNAQGLPPRRIVIFRRDSTPVPRSLQKFLYVDTFDRRATDHAIHEVTAQEHAT